MRICRVCKNDETQVEFYKKTICKGCNSEYMKDYRARNAPKISQQVQGWKDQNRDHYRATNRANHATEAGKAAHVARVERTPRSWLSHIYAGIKRKCLNPGPHEPKDPVRRTLEIDLDFVMGLWETQQGRCALTGMHLGHRYNAPLAASIDRKDSTQGYVPGNVQLVCQWVNRAKQHMPNEDFKALLLYSREKAEFVVSRWSPEDRGNPARPFCPEVAMFLKLVYDRVVEEFWNFPLQVTGEWWVLVVEIGQGPGVRPHFRLAWDDVGGSVLGLDFVDQDTYAGDAPWELCGVDIGEPMAVDLVVASMGNRIRATRAI